MLFDIKLDKNSPVYIQISNYIKSMILKGMIRKDEKLPSTRELASMLKVSRNTIISAYEFLQDDGFIYIKKEKELLFLMLTFMLKKSGKLTGKII